MNETQVRTLEQVRQVLEGTQALLLNARQPEERYAWIAQVLQRLAYRRLGRNNRGAVLAYVQRFSGYSRAQVTRLIARRKSASPG
ncbi:hypothetical protein [Extensimonas sp. H3M7-6]|uniref:hypothetical protein n=1 Tax=Extensimonas soli TaxID=3031322 RepID=UPI0023DB4912|nr:hypothetical protein [Extensimonas sp. H3M7-6]MDF1481320.1 hypothetical protein [Extensimonas sp. H3M7-6]